MTRAEWERLAPLLSDAQRAKLREPTGPAPVTCPLLEDGACSVYDARPIACRTHGFYADRDAVLACAQVMAAVETHAADVTWGNGEAIASDLRPHGEFKSLAGWLTEDEVGLAPA